MIHKFYLSFFAMIGLGAMAALQIHTDTLTAYKEIAELACVLAAIIGTAYVTRSDTQNLKKWAWDKGGVNEQMTMMRQILAALSATAQSNEQRIRRIEGHEDDRRRGR